MKMSEPKLCCDECFDIIAKESTTAAHMWLDFCEFQITLPIFCLVTPFLNSIKLLENMGFILTTETQDIIIVKVLGRKDDLAGPYFCCGRCHGN